MPCVETGKFRNLWPVDSIGYHLMAISAYKSRASSSDPYFQVNNISSGLMLQIFAPDSHALPHLETVRLRREVKASVPR